MIAFPSHRSRIVILGLTAGVLSLAGADRAHAEAQLLIEASTIYRLVFFVQALFYAAALATWPCERMGLRLGPLSLPYYFVLANAASLVGFAKFMRGEAHLTWEPLRESAGQSEIAVGTNNLVREQS